MTVLKISQPIAEDQSTQFGLENGLSLCGSYEATLIEGKELYITSQTLWPLVSLKKKKIGLFQKVSKAYWHENDCLTASCKIVNAFSKTLWSCHGFCSEN